MGIHQKLSTRPRHGIALPAALFGLVTVTVLGGAIYSMTMVQNQSTKNRVSTTQALLIAEEGAAHAVSVVRDTLKAVYYTDLLRGSDKLPNTTDDGRLTGYTLSAGISVPVAGKSTTGGSYTVQLLDDPAETDGQPLIDTNHRLLVRCHAVTTDGATATVDVLLSAILLPGIAAEGQLKISGSGSTVSGACGNVHVNGPVDVTGALRTSGKVSSTGTVSGAVETLAGGANPPINNQPPVPIPDLNPMDYCADADYVMQANGFILRTSDNTLHDARSVEQFGWKRSSTSPLSWDLAGASAVAGKMCITGNVKVSGNPGTPASPLAMTIVATGSLEISGNPFLKPAKGDSISLMAGGDLSISGNPDASKHNFDGLIYSESQCKVAGSPRLQGQLVCKNKPNAAGTVNLASLNEISGDLDLTYSCGGLLGAKRQMVYWAQPVY